MCNCLEDAQAHVERTTNHQSSVSISRTPTGLFQIPVVSTTPGSRFRVPVIAPYCPWCGARQREKEVTPPTGVPYDHEMALRVVYRRFISGYGMGFKGIVALVGHLSRVVREVMPREEGDRYARQVDEMWPSYQIGEYNKHLLPLGYRLVPLVGSSDRGQVGDSYSLEKIQNGSDERSA